MKKTGTISVFSVSLLVLVMCIFSTATYAATSYNFSSSVDGFVARGAATIRYSADGNGRLYMDTTGSDPGMVKSLSMSASENNVLKTYVWTYCTEKTLQLYFKRSGSATVYDGGSVVLSNGSSGGEYTIDLSGNSNWTGTISEIRIDPSVSCGSESTPGFIAFDYVSFEQKNGSITGGVRDSVTDNPISNALVRLEQNSQIKYSVYSNSSGVYTITDVVPGSYNLVALKADYDSQTIAITIASSQKTQNITMDPQNGSVSGGVRDNSDSTLISGATVRLEQGGVIKQTTTSNSSGNFTFSTVLEGSYNLVALKSGYSNWSQSITVSGGEELQQNIAMVPNVGSASGGVRDYSTSNPLNNALVRLEQSQVIKYTTYSNSTGNYSFSDVTPGTYDLVAIFSGYCNFTVSITITAGNNNSQNIAMDEAVASTPGTASGENEPTVGTSYHYTTSGSSACIGKTIEYRFNWGDGATSSWSVNKYADKTWSTPNSSGYSVIVEARCQENPEAISSSASLLVKPAAANTLPNVNITSPQDGSSVTSVSITVSGTASDSDQEDTIQVVQVRINSGNWQTVSGTNNWSIGLTVVDGTNTIEAKAQDSHLEWSTIKSITITKNVPEIVLQSIAFQGINKTDVQPNPYEATITAIASGGSSSSVDSMVIYLNGTYSGYLDSIILTETGENTGEFTGSAWISPIRPSSGNITISVVEDNDWGDGNEFLSQGTGLGKAHGFGLENSYPAATVSAVKAAGFEKISISYNGTTASGITFPSVFVKCQAEWFMYSGHGLSDIFCPSHPGSVDMGDEEHGTLTCSLPLCSPSDIPETDSWNDVRVVIFAACSVFNADKDYGISWFSIDGPEYYLGYRDSAPESQGVAIIQRWKELVDQGENKALAWMKANGEVLAWNSSAYDKNSEFYWYFSGIHMINNPDLPFVKNLDVEGYNIATGGGFYEPEGLSATVVSDSQINLSWNYGINDPGVQWEYYVVRSRTNSIDDAESSVRTNSTSYSDSGLSSGTTYYYWIGIRAGDYEPVFSSPVSAVTTGSSGGGGSTPPPNPDPEAPQAPTNLRIVE